MPWPASVTRRLAELLWPRLAELVNTPNDEAARRWPLYRDKSGELTSLFGLRANVHGALRDVLAGRCPFPGHSIRATPLCLISRGGKVEWGIAQTRLVERVPLFAVVEKPSHQEVNAVQKEMMFTVLLLWLPEVRPLLRRCALVTCGRFNLGKRSRRARERRYFCPGACRRAWEKSPQGRTETARRQREYRERFPSRRRVAGKRTKE